MNLELMSLKETCYLAECFEKENVKSSRFDDQVIYEPGYLKTGQGKPFSVFTPFKRRWIEKF